MLLAIATDLTEGVEAKNATANAIMPLPVRPVHHTA